MKIIFKLTFLTTAIIAFCRLGAAEPEKFTMEFCGKRTKLYCNNNEVTFADCLAEQLKFRAKQQFRDWAKQAYQGAFGAGHAVLNRQRAWEYFSREFAGVEARDEELFEIISPDYCRVNLGAWKKAALPKEWLFNMFLASTEIYPDSAALFKSYLEQIARSYPETAAEMAEFIKHHRGEAVHHSREYVRRYRPSYRIVSTRFLTVIPVLKKLVKLPEKPIYVIAVDGRAASGKTTLSGQLAMVLGAEVIHMDDFFLPQDLRTRERLAEAGGNVHYERFSVEVLPNLRNAKSFSYRKFDCSKMALGGNCTVDPSKWRVVEGAYSLHPAFGNYADLKIFFDISPEEQMKRIRRRNGLEKAKIFASRWIPLEENYIRKTGVMKRADLILGTR